MDEALDPDSSMQGMSLHNWRICQGMEEPRIRHRPCGPLRGDWHQTVKAQAITITEAECLVFPADDAYYAPVFIEQMLLGAAQGNAELIYCNWVYNQMRYMPWTANPRTGHIDVGGFMVRKTAALRVPWTSRAQTGDGKWIEELVASGVRHARLDQTLYVKN